MEIIKHTQFRFSRITAVLIILTIGILVSYTSAEQQSGRESSFSDTSSHVTKEAQDSYILTPGVGVYKIHTHAKTWHEAREVCQKEGGDLAIINSEAESRVVGALVAKSYPHYGSYNSYFVLIGFHDLDKEGHYVTIDGRTLKEAGFVEWVQGAPDNWIGREHCGSISKTGKFNDVYCDEAYAFACELSLIDEVEGTSDEDKPENIEQSSDSNGVQGSHGVEDVMISILCPLYLLALSL